MALNLEIYLEPEVFEALQKGKKSFTHDEFKSDVFSLGLCILEAGLL